MQARIISLAVGSWHNEQILQAALSAMALPALILPYLSQPTFPNNQSMERLATGLQKVAPIYNVGRRDASTMALSRGLESPDSPHTPAALIFAIERGWRRSIAYFVLNYNKHNKCEKAKLDSSQHYCSLCWYVSMK